MWTSLLIAKCQEAMRDLDADSIDAGITDPPYGIGFMNKAWDTFRPGSHRESKRPQWWSVDHPNPNIRNRHRSPAVSPSQIEYDMSRTGLVRFQTWTTEWALEVLRVLKPGAHLLVCGAPRSFHRMTVGLEDAGFEIRDCLMWLFGQGFPKSKNLGDGWGTALKPAWEPIILARKPLPKGMTTERAYRTLGTGGLHIDACRIAFDDDESSPAAARRASARRSGNAPMQERTLGVVSAREANALGKFGRRGSALVYTRARENEQLGRWPANLMLDADAAAMLDDQTGVLTSRFFYCPKTSRAERNFGCETLPQQSAGEMTGGRRAGSRGLHNPRAGAGRTSGAFNAHPTVKPIALMRYLVRLVVPAGGIVLDPFVGSGSTAIAALLEHRSCIGIDQEQQWITVARHRVRAWKRKVT